MEAQQDQTFVQTFNLKQAKSGTFQFSGPAYKSWSVDQAADELINLFPEMAESGTGKSRVALYGTPGLSLFAALGPGPIRGMWTGVNSLLIVSGPQVWAYEGGGPWVEWGTVADDGKPVSMAANYNSTQVVLASGGNLYCDSGSGIKQVYFSVPYTDLAIDASDSTIVTSAAQPFVSGPLSAGGDVGATLNITGGSGFNVGTYTITAVDGSGKATLSGSAGATGSTAGTGIEQQTAVPAVEVTYLDTFFVAISTGPHPTNTADQRRFYLSASNDGTTWDATQFATKDSYADNIAAILADHEELWLFGSEQSVECWRNAGTAPIPFARDDSGSMHYGIAAPATAVRFLQGFAFLGMDQERGGPFAFYVQGMQPVRISNHAVETAWGSYATCADAIVYSYNENGHAFLVFNFPSGNATWVYDGATQMWHQRGWWNGSGFDRQRQCCHAYVDLGSGPKHYVGDWQNGNIYVQSMGTYTDNGTPIVRVRTAPHISDEQTLNFYHRLQLDLETGTGGNGFNAGSYLITAVDGSGKATLSGVAGTTGAAGGTGTEQWGLVFFTDLAINAGNAAIISSALAPFTARDVGAAVTIYSGLTGFTAGTYTVLSVDGSGNATLNAAAGTPGATSGWGQESRSLLYSDLAIDVTNANVVTSAAQPFGPRDVGATLNINAGGALNPVLDWSDDGGHTFGQYNQGPSLGSPGPGSYGYRVIWTPLGASRDRVFRVTIQDPVKIAITNAYLDCTAGSV
jgi:hypothetical protein